MADVGILNLQIHHDSSQAEAGLQKLADALFRIRRAVKDGLQLSGVASQIRHIAKAVNENVSDSTISRIAFPSVFALPILSVYTLISYASLV